ncbi:hypothetical protein J6590_028116 [Homalodisca vitripennis]|nr:hypothetical protein J6590_028116 [Homalodisca vitripennis]
MTDDADKISFHDGRCSRHASCTRAAATACPGTSELTRPSYPPTRLRDCPIADQTRGYAKPGTRSTRHCAGVTN